MANYSQTGEYKPMSCVSKHPQCKAGTDAICVPCQDQHMDAIRNLLAAQGSMIGKFHQLKCRGLKRAAVRERRNRSRPSPW